MKLLISQSLHAKVVATRKSLIAGHKSVYFGPLEDEDLALAARYSQNSNVLALLLRSKNKFVRESLAKNGGKAAYRTSLALLKDSTTSVKEAVLEYAWLEPRDFEQLAESGTEDDHLQVLTTKTWWGNDLQLYRLSRNPNLKDEFFRKINIQALTSYILAKRGYSSPYWRTSLTREITEIRNRRQPKRSGPIGTALLPRLKQIEEEILHLNHVQEKPIISDETNKSASWDERGRTGVSKQQDRRLASKDDLTLQEFEFLIFTSRDEKTRKLAIANPALPYSLFDRVVEEFALDAHTSTYFWVKYLEDPHFLGKPALPIARKLILNPDTPESFIEETYQRYEGGQEEGGRLMSKWFNTLLAIANHPNTPLWILDRLAESHRSELQEAAWAHPKKG